MEEVDHYAVLGLTSGEEGSKLTDQDISQAYRKQALKLHPDKSRNDPDAPAKFLNLQISYEILKDPKTRKQFDDLLRVRRDKRVRDKQFDAKRRRMMSDLEEREKAAFVDPDRKARDEEERIMRDLAKEVATIRAMMAKKPEFVKEERKENVGGVGLDKSKVLKVSWEKDGEQYTASRLRDLFEEFGDVEDVVIKSSKKNKGSALVVMGSKEGAVAASEVMVGDLSNPLLVLPLQPANPMPSVRAQAPLEGDEESTGKFAGAGFKAFEDSVLDKLRKAAEKQKLNKKET